MTEGISKKEAGRLLKKCGKNEIEEVSQNSVFQILLRQVKNNFIVYLLGFAMIISFFVGKDLTAYTILVVIIIVIGGGFIQEYKAEKAISSLKKMITSYSTVIRAGKEQQIDSKEIVPGDVIVLRAGEKIPADSLILEENELKVNESVLTGESVDVKKKIHEGKGKPKDENLVFTGTYVVNGRCVAKVLKTGMDTRFGKIAGMISDVEKDLPLQRKVNQISKYLAFAGLTMSVITGLIMLLRLDVLTEEAVIGILILIIAVAVASFPEGFPVVLITTLASGAYRMAKRNAIVNRMSIIETLGQTTVICSDKTGTITKGEMTVKKIFCDNCFYDVSGVGYDSEGDILYRKEKEKLDKNETLQKFIKGSVLCNDSRIEKQENSTNYNVFGSHTEAALLIMGVKAGIHKEDMKISRITQKPFDSERKMMSVAIKETSGKYVYVKGATEILLDKCTHIQRKDGVFKITRKEKEKILSKNESMTKNAYRTLAVAYKKYDSNKSKLEEGLIFLGFGCISDPPRKEVKEAIRICNKAGIKVKMVTGDHKDTAIAIAKQVGLEGNVLEGREIDKMSDKQLSEIMKNTTIFARVKPEHKLRIVKALKNKGEIVTMTGDGVNDAPALKEAHIGVAMGITGTDVSRSVADLTLKDDNFATIVEAIKEGRTIFSNIKKFSTYQISINFAQVSLIFLSVLLGMPLPLVAIQILFMNLLSDEITALSLGFGPASLDSMDKKPRKNTHLIEKGQVMIIIFAGLFMGLVSLGVFGYSYYVLENTEELSRSLAFSTMVFFGLTNAFNFRSFRAPFYKLPLFANKYLVYAFIIVSIIFIALVYSPFNNIIETVQLPATYLVFSIIAAFSIIIVFDIIKVINNRKDFLKMDL